MEKLHLKNLNIINMVTLSQKDVLLMNILSAVSTTSESTHFRCFGAEADISKPHQTNTETCEARHHCSGNASFCKLGRTDPLEIRRLYNERKWSCRGRTDGAKDTKITRD